jgi:Uma2 family endonuclease
MSATLVPLPETGTVRYEDLPETTWPRLEIFDGSLHVSPAPNQGHQYIVGKLFIALDQAAPADYKVLLGANVFQRAETDRLLIPDIVVIDVAGWDPREANIDPKHVFLTVEILSPSTRHVDLGAKRDLYAEWRVPIYWVLDPKTREVHEWGIVDSAQSWLGDVDLTSVWPEDN